MYVCWQYPPWQWVKKVLLMHPNCDLLPRTGHLRNSVGIVPGETKHSHIPLPYYCPNTDFHHYLIWAKTDSKHKRKTVQVELRPQWKIRSTIKKILIYSLTKNMSYLTKDFTTHSFREEAKKQWCQVTKELVTTGNTILLFQDLSKSVPSRSQE